MVRPSQSLPHLFLAKSVRRFPDPHRKCIQLHHVRSVKFNCPDCNVAHRPKYCSDCGSKLRPQVELKASGSTRQQNQQAGRVSSPEVTIAGQDASSTPSRIMQSLRRSANLARRTPRLEVIRQGRTSNQPHMRENGLPSGNSDDSNYVSTDSPPSEETSAADFPQSLMGRVVTMRRQRAKSVRIGRPRANSALSGATAVGGLQRIRSENDGEPSLQELADRGFEWLAKHHGKEHAQR